MTTPYHRLWHVRPIAWYSKRQHRYFCTVCPLPRDAVGLCAVRGENAHLIRCTVCRTPIVNHADPDVSVSNDPRATGRG